MTYKLILKPLEEYRIGLRQSSGIVLENVDVVSAFPSPTTILGIIGKLNNYKPSDKRGIEDLKEAYKSLTRNELNDNEYKAENPLIWGPIIRKGEANNPSVHYPLLFNKLILDVKKYVNLALSPLNVNYTEILIEEMHIQNRRMNQINRNSKNTIHLFYQKFFSNEYVLEYCINAEINDSKVVELGGENRYSRINVITDECNYGEGDYAVLLQPLLFEVDNEYFVKLDKVKGFECSDEIYGVLVEKGNRFDYKVKSIYYALGYGNERRPMLQALPPGTIIKVKEECKEAKALGLLSQLGFGAIYKVKNT
ncbi:hypothetical protein [Saccharolobus islandicus]|uniref:hypothetical protein n=1 Tax=Saccharolobus islandicus TaxID=43080 RepID=UPI000377BAC6|nr:hypothetical protein [Sulfolobus islandicus]